MTTFNVGDAVVFINPLELDKAFITGRKEQMGNGPYTVVRVRNLLGALYRCDCSAGNEELDCSKHSDSCSVGRALRSNQNQLIAVNDNHGAEHKNFSGYWFCKSE